MVPLWWADGTFLHIMAFFTFSKTKKNSIIVLQVREAKSADFDSPDTTVAFYVKTSNDLKKKL